MWQDKINEVNCQDCLELMKEMPDKCVDLVLTDPPYGINVGKPRERERERVNQRSVVGIKGLSLPKDIGGLTIAKSPQKKSLTK